MKFQRSGILGVVDADSKARADSFVCLHRLIQIAFPFDFFSTDPVGVAPVEFSFAYLTVLEANHSDPSQFSPGLTLLQETEKSGIRSRKAPRFDYSKKEMSASSSTIRVFVSSTWKDLASEQRAVEKVLQRIRETRFVGMEHFGSRDEDTRYVSLDEVDRCHVYVGIIGNRYGSGITEAEYRRAREQNLPCFIYFKDEAVILPEERESDPEKIKRLALFKEELLRNHTIAPPFSTPDGLAAGVAADLYNWLFDHYLPQLLSGISTDYAARIKNFLTEYLGTPEYPVPFGGREADLTILNQWLDNPSASPYLLLAAPAGRGKSALLTRWGAQLLARDDVAVVFFPVSVRFRTNLSSVVFVALATRLAALHGEKKGADPNTPAEVWRGVITEYLVRPLPDGKT
jgi:hypothetical protein